MFNISEIRPGNRITVSYVSPVTWARVKNNPYRDTEVTKAVKAAFTAAGAETYERQMEKHGKIMSGAPSWHVPALEIGPCVRKHAKDASRLYLAGINHDYLQSSFYVNGTPATPEQTAEIREWTDKNRPERMRGEDFQVWTVDKLQNATLTD